MRFIQSLGRKTEKNIIGDINKKISFKLPVVQTSTTNLNT